MSSKSSFFPKYNKCIPIYNENERYNKYRDKCVDKSDRKRCEVGFRYDKVKIFVLKVKNVLKGKYIIIIKKNVFLKIILKLNKNS